MQSTNPKALRAELKDFLDAALNEPIRINRRDKSCFILCTEGHYRNLLEQKNTILELQSEILSLQRRLLGMTEVAARKLEPVDLEEDRLARFKK